MVCNKKNQWRDLIKSEYENSIFVNGVLVVFDHRTFDECQRDNDQETLRNYRVVYPASEECEKLFIEEDMKWTVTIFNDGNIVIGNEILEGAQIGTWFKPNGSISVETGEQPDMAREFKKQCRRDGVKDDQMQLAFMDLIKASISNVIQNKKNGGDK